VVYYAGHGIEVDGGNYLIPVDARLERDTDIYDEGLSLDRILIAIEPAKKLRLVILDACRDNPFARTMKRTVASRAIGEIAQGAAGLRRRQVAAGIDHVEAGLFQRRCDPGAIVNGIGQRRDVAIGGIAEHQRHALFGKRRPADQQEAGGCKGPSAQF
jgi:hypothetical protein